MSDSTSTLSNSGLQTPINVALEILDLEKQCTNSIFDEAVRTFSWESVSVTIPVPNGEKAILENSNGIVKAGEMLAIMGPSGCGKTTLLNVLARRASIPNSTVEGDVRVNGGPAALGTFRKISSFVEQEDALIGALTVTETLYFVARLSLSGYVTIP
jgi:ABC-type multidrug transport system ATPase subunit